MDIPSGATELFLSILLLGATFVAVLLAGWQRRGFLWPLLSAFVIRCVAALTHRFLAILPQGGADAVTFESRAWEWAQSGCGNMGEHLALGASYVHAWLVGNVYACTDRAPLVFQGINVVLGVVTVYLVARIAEELWDREAAVRAAWVAALFPILIINAAVPLREVWFTAPFLLGVLWLVQWVFSRRIAYLGGAFAVILAAGVIHGGAVFALLGVALVLLGWLLVEAARASLVGRVRTGIVFGGFAVVGVIAVGSVAFDDARFSSIGTIGNLGDRVEELAERAAEARGGSAYPQYLVPENDFALLVLTPVRMGYLLFGPPPWEIREAFHLVGALDGLLYLALVVLLARYWRVWWHRREFRLLLVVFVVMTIVFAWGVNNFGTGVRHRAKFLGILLALGSGLLGRRRWRDARINAVQTKWPQWRRRES